MIIINQLEEDDSYWVTSDDNPNGVELHFPEHVSEEKRIMISVAEFLGLDPETNLCMEDDSPGEPQLTKGCCLDDCCSIPHDKTLLKEQNRKPVILPSKTLAFYEDSFENTVIGAAYDLFGSCLREAGSSDHVDFNDFLDAVYDGDHHNEFKEIAYKLFREMGFDIESDGTSF